MDSTILQLNIDVHVKPLPFKPTINKKLKTMEAIDLLTNEWVTVICESDMGRTIKFKNGHIEKRFLYDVRTNPERFETYLRQVER